MRSPEDEKMPRALWYMPDPDGGRSVFEVTLSRALRLARQLALVDPEGAAADALAHLYERYSRQPDRFTQEDGGVDLEAFYRWSRVLLRNRLLDLRRRDTREGRHYVREGVEDGRHQLPGGLERVDAGHWQGATAEMLLLERDKLFLLFQLINDLRVSQRDVLLARMAGFSREQIARALNYGELSQSVLVSRLRPRFMPRAYVLDLPAGVPFSEPREDPPLMVPSRPNLSAALQDLSSPLGTGLLLCVMALNDLALPLLSRMAGFWDCVSAAVLERSVEEYRERLLHGADQVEEALASRPSKPGQTGRYTARSSLGGKMNVDESTRILPSELMAVMRRLAQRRPDLLLEVLLHDLEVARALTLGREGRGHPEMSVDFELEGKGDGLELAETDHSLVMAGRSLERSEAWDERWRRLWTLACDRLSAVREWEVISPALAMRGGGEDDAPTVSRPRAHLFDASAGGGDRKASGVVLAFARLAPARDAKHLLVWQVEKTRIGLAYPRMPWDPTLGQQLQGRQFMVHLTDPDAPLRLIATWLEVREAPLQHVPGASTLFGANILNGAKREQGFGSGSREEAERALMTWLEAALGGRLPHVDGYAVTLKPEAAGWNET